MTVQSYREVRTREQLNKLLHYGHIIPISRGLTTKYVGEHYPGWTWNALIRVLSAADVYVGQGGAPPHCDDRVVRVHFDSHETWRVEWADGRVTEGAAAPGTTWPDIEHGCGLRVLDLPAGRRVEDRGI